MATVTCDESTVDDLKTRLSSIYTVLETYRWIIEAYLSDFYVEDHWSRLPSSWQRYLGQLDFSHLASLLTGGPWCQPTEQASVSPLSLLALKACCGHLSLDRRYVDVDSVSVTTTIRGTLGCTNNTSDAGADSRSCQKGGEVAGKPAGLNDGRSCQKGGEVAGRPAGLNDNRSCQKSGAVVGKPAGLKNGQLMEMHHIFRKHVKPKKQHEIRQLGKVIKLVSQLADCDHVVDVGAGLGHLSRLLTFAHGLKVTTVEATGGHAPKASEFDRELKNDIQKKLQKTERAAQQEKTTVAAPSDLPAHVVCTVQPDISTEDFLRLVTDCGGGRESPVSGEAPVRNDKHFSGRSRVECHVSSLSTTVKSGERREDQIPMSSVTPAGNEENFSGRSRVECHVSSLSTTVKSGERREDQIPMSSVTPAGNEENFSGRSRTECQVSSLSTSTSLKSGEQQQDKIPVSGETPVVNKENFSASSRMECQMPSSSTTVKSDRDLRSNVCARIPGSHVVGHPSTSAVLAAASEVRDLSSQEGAVGLGPSLVTMSSGETAAKVSKYDDHESQCVLKNSMAETKHCCNQTNEDSGKGKCSDTTEDLRNRDCSETTEEQKCSKSTCTVGSGNRKWSESTEDSDNQKCSKNKSAEDSDNRNCLSGSENPRGVEGGAETQGAVVAQRLVLAGLHACGDLTATILRVFVNCPLVSALVSVGCCYMKLSAHSESDGDKEKGYPMSRFVRSLRAHPLTYEAREMACHFADAYAQRLMDNPPHLKIHSYRAAVQYIVTETRPDFPHGATRLVIKRGAEMPFAQYASECLRRLGIPPGEVRAGVVGRAEALTGEWRRVVAFYTLRLSLAPLLETALLLDRMLFLTEHGVPSVLLPVFDSALSPRNFALLACKPTQ